MFDIAVEQEYIDKLPTGCFPGKITVIDRFGVDYLHALAYLHRQSIIGFDTETRPVFSPHAPQCKVALLQLSGEREAFLFRLNKMGLRRSLCAILANPHIIKVGAASSDDVHGLQKRAKFKSDGFIDLQRIAWQWGIRDKSVKKLAANILGVRISKTQQLSNWEAEELSESQKKYAATDAWVCREMYLKLLKSEKHPLTPEEQIPPQQLEQMREAQERRAEKRKKAMEENAQKQHHRRKKRKKKNTGNVQNNTEKGA